jgi:small conductance mechanosensitive channel
VATLLEQLARAIGRPLALEEASLQFLARLLTIAGALLLGWIAYRLLLRLIHRLVQSREGEPEFSARAQRARTLGPLLSNVSRYVVAFVVGAVVLHELGIDVRALMVSAGVVGLAVGLGAQSLIKDVITGFFILFENLLAVGDSIEVGPHQGVVESVGLRVTTIRKFSGELRVIPNGELTTFGIHSAGWTRAVVEVGVPYEQDVARVLGILETVGRAFRESAGDQVLEPPAAEGILRFGDAGLVMRLHVRVDARRKAELELDLRRRVKDALQAAGIPIAYPQLMVHLGGDPRRAPVTPSHEESPV